MIFSYMKKGFIYTLILGSMLTITNSAYTETIEIKDLHKQIIATQEEIDNKINYIESEIAVKIVTKEELTKKKYEEDLKSQKHKSKNNINALDFLSSNEKTHFIEQVEKQNTLENILEIEKIAQEQNTENRGNKTEDSNSEKFEIVTTYTTNNVAEAFEKISKELKLSNEDIEGWKFIIFKESGWNTTATNPSSGAYGLGQALPASKMSPYGDDYLTNPYTQLRWMYSYIIERYGSINNAVSFWNNNGWY